MAATGNIYFGNPNGFGVSDKAFHLDHDAEPERVIKLLQNCAHGVSSFAEFLGTILIVSGSPALGDLRIGDIKPASYDYYADYDFNAIRVVLNKGIVQSDAEKYLRYASEAYGKIGRVSYIKDLKAIQLVAELQPGKEPPHIKDVSRMMKGSK